MSRWGYGAYRVITGGGETVEVQVGGCHFHFKPLDTQQGEQSGAAAA